MKHAREKKYKMTGTVRMLAILLVSLVTLILGAAAPQVWAGGQFCVEELDEAEVFIEYNSTDDDRGIQFFWDGEAWKWMRVKNESHRAVLDVIAQRNVRAQGLTEGFFESAEPTGDELPADEFFARFPEGDYKFRGRTLDGCLLIGEAELTHDLPIPVDIDLEGFPTIEWTQPEGGPDVVGYELVVELVVLVDVDGEEEERVFTETTLYPAGFSTHIVGDRFQELIMNPPGEIDELKVEIIAREESGNKTITEEEVELE